MASIPIKTGAVVVYVLRDNKGVAEILLLKRNKGNALDEFWLHVAGKIEADETASAAAIRELQEETGIVTDRIYTANYCEQLYSVGENAIICLPMFVAYVDNNQQVVINHEHKEYTWAPYDQAYDMVPFANQRENLRIIKENFIDRIPHDFLRLKR